MSIASQSPQQQQQQQPRPILTDSPTRQYHSFVSVVSSPEASSPVELVSDSSVSQAILSDASSQPKPKSILENAHGALPRKPSWSGSESGFKAALKATFLPPPTPGRQIKVKDGKKLGKTFQRTDPLPERFQGGQVLEYDPRGKDATAGDGILPSGCTKPPSFDRRDSASESGYGSDKESSVGTPSEMGDASQFSRSYTSEASSARGPSMNDQSERGRPTSSVPSRARQGSVASTTSSSSSAAAIKFAPLPMSGRLKRANSITIGVAARSHLLQSQGTAAPPRSSCTPQHVHGSQAWYTNNAGNVHPRHEGVVDVGQEIKKGATKAWKLLRGTGGGNASDRSNSSNNNTPATESAPAVKAATQAALLEKAKKTFPKEGALVADHETGQLKMANGSVPVNTTPKISQGQVSDQAKKAAVPAGSGDQTPRRAASPRQHLRSMSISEEPEAEEAAAAIEAAHAKNAAKAAHLPNGHHPHDLQDGPQHNTYHLADDHDAAHLDSGTVTPKSAMQRRLSTGAFLRGLSLRGIQEDRRRDLLGLDADDDEQQRLDSGEKGLGDERKMSAEGGRHGIAVRTPAGTEEELGLEGYGHS
ncbi:uncharacterized protein UBRO_20736 [Ustilago bromivora]|uniref:Uncharacterized protein n=1 Tax=Ustilago bromivora TaxID=307758 RepID=A0A1K0HF62_9BASI|nr:uncharacterized protein UBRO_20736 [Ustilago bromivora]